MPVPAAISSLSETASSNSPGGSEAVGTNANDYLQAAFAFVAQLYHGKWAVTQDVPIGGFKLTNLANGTANTDAATIGQLNTVLGAPSGTRMVFQQATAPTGWAVDSSAYLQDAAVRFNAGAGSGGSVGWSSWNFGATYTTDGTALTVAQMPYHNHGDAGHSHGVSDPGHNHGVYDPGHNHAIPDSTPITGSGWPRGFTAGGADIAGYRSPNVNYASTGIGIYNNGTGIGIATNYANIGYTGGSAAHTHTFRGPQTKFADVVVCVKS